MEYLPTDAAKQANGEGHGAQAPASFARGAGRRIYDGNLILPGSRAVSPQPANRGDTGYIDEQTRQFPAKVLLVGIDTVSEAFNVKLCPFVEKDLEAQDEAARTADWDGLQQFRLGDMSAVLKPPRKGLKYRIELEGFSIDVRYTPEWAVTIRYGSTGLWQTGADLLRANALDLLRKIANIPHERDVDGEICEQSPEKWQRLSEIHIAVDMQSQKLSDEMTVGFTKKFVCHGGVKKFLVESADDLQTVTVGKTLVQVQIYDKAREIKEASGKTWFYELWERNAGKLANLENIWRVETRIYADWLKDRGCYTWEQFHENAALLVHDALMTRRLCEPTKDQNRARWPLHWLWNLVLLKVAGEIMPRPLGLRLQRDTEALPEKLKRTAAGVIRAAAVAYKSLNPYDRRSIEDLARDMGRDTMAILLQDQNHQAKVSSLVERYRNIAKPA